VLIDATAVPNQKFTAMFNEQIIVAIQGKFKPFCSQSLQGGILFDSQLNAGKTSAAGCIAGSAAFVAVFGMVQQYAAQLFPAASPQRHFPTLLSDKQ
jgi:hypothetical protein